MIRWTVYVHRDCGLCESLLEELAALLGPAAGQVTVIDVATDPELERRYGARVPVLTADGDFVCQYRLDQDRVRTWLSIG